MVCIDYVSLCIYVYLTIGAYKGQRGQQIWSWSYRQLWPPHLGTRNLTPVLFEKPSKCLKFDVMISNFYMWYKSKRQDYHNLKVALFHILKPQKNLLKPVVNKKIQ